MLYFLINTVEKVEISKVGEINILGNVKMSEVGEIKLPKKIPPVSVRPHIRGNKEYVCPRLRN